MMMMMMVVLIVMKIEESIPFVLLYDHEYTQSNHTLVCAPSSAFGAYWPAGTTNLVPAKRCRMVACLPLWDGIVT